MIHGIRSTLALVGSVAVLSAECCDSGCPPPEPDPELPVGTIDILPWRVTTVKDGSFTLKARLRDQYGNTLPDYRANEVRWKSEDGSLVVQNAPSANVLVTANPGATPLPVTKQLTAYIGSITRVADITIVSPASPPDGDVDWITSSYSPKDNPTVALVNGIAVHGAVQDPRVDMMIAFVRESPLDTLDCPDGTGCGEISVFSPNHAVARRPMKWARTCDFVPVATDGAMPTGCGTADQMGGTLSPLKDPVRIPVWVWNASAVPFDRIDEDVNYARRVYGDAGAGIKLDATVISPGLYERDIHADVGGNCNGGWDDIPTQFPDVQFDPKRITILVVDDVNESSGTIPGFTCEYNSFKGTIIILAANHDGSPTLAHELGHALGQWTPPAPIHPDEWHPSLTGIDPSNLLWSADVEGGGGPRRFLSLGQIFHIHFSTVGFVTSAQLSTTPRLTCDTDPTKAVPCPPMATDVTH